MNEAKPTPREVLRDALRECVEEICAITKERAADRSPYLEEKKIWERGEDGVFRSRSIPVPFTAILLIKYGPKFDDLDSYRRALEAAQADPLVAPQIDALVGAASLGALRVDGERIVRSLVGAMATDDGQVEFSEQKFHKKWEEIAGALYSNELTRVTLAPLPYLVAPFPIKLSEGIELDRLTDEEVTYCAEARLLGQEFAGMDFIQPQQAIGLRCVASAQKTVGEQGIAADPTQGEFGRRPAWAQYLLVGDILAALRMVKEGIVRSPGHVSTVRGWLFGGMRQYAFRGGSPFYFGQYELNDTEAVDLQKVWAQLGSGVLEERRFLAASLRRFNLALDRDLMEDRIVDLMIAAESLFLHDVGRPQDRGESRFRLSLRAAAFVDSPRYTKRQVFSVMREGYDVRSKVVHGGTVDKSRLPDKTDATVTDLASAVEGIMRAGLRKGLVTPEISNEGFWESLLLPDQGRALT